MNTAPKSSWTVERIEALKALWATGMSARDIAGELGGVSRNGVLSKIHRMGMSQRVKGWHAAHPTCKVRPRPRANPTVYPAPQPSRGIGDPEGKRQRLSSGALQPLQIRPSIFDDAIPPGQRKTLLKLKWATSSAPGDCRWPCGTPGTPEFFYCGAPQSDAKPYCADHCAVAFQPRRSHHQPGA